MRLFNLIYADQCIVDQRSNQVSVINLLENIFSNSFPAIHPVLTVLAIFEKEAADETKIQARLDISISGERIVTAPIEIAFGGGPMARTILEFQGFPITKPGRLDVECFVGEHRIGSWSGPIIPLSPSPIDPEQGKSSSSTNVAAAGA